jgi:hypothetical protein
MPPCPESRTFYVVSPAVSWEDNTPESNLFNNSPSLKAEVEFDLPKISFQGSDDPDPPIWAVGLNFKSGDETDLGAAEQLLIGVTCQFRDVGTTRFHGTVGDPAWEHYSTYDDYDAFGSVFRLSISLTRTVNTVKAYGSFFINGNQLRSDEIATSMVPEDAMLLNLAESSASDKPQITAVGVAVVNFGQDVKGNPLLLHTVSVRLRKFSLSYLA